MTSFLFELLAAIAAEASRPTLLGLPKSDRAADPLLPSNQLTGPAVAEMEQLIAMRVSLALHA